MKRIITLSVSALYLTGCGGIHTDSVESSPEPSPTVTVTVTVQGPQGPKGDAGQALEVSPTPSSTFDVDQVINLENDYRQSVGQVPLVEGLTCTLYNVPNTTSQIVGATLTNMGSFTYKGDFNQPNVSASVGLNILPDALQPLYTQWFIVKCSGQFVSTENKYYEFDITSDDGSNLYLDGSLLINNDGQHGAQTKYGTKFLRRQIHSFELDYFEGPAGNEALILNMDNELLPKEKFYH